MQNAGKFCKIVHERLPSCYYTNFSTAGGNKARNLLNRELRMLRGIPAFFYIAPEATNIAAAQPYKVSSPALVITFALNGIKMLHYRKRNSMVCRICHCVQIENKMPKHGKGNINKKGCLIFIQYNLFRF